jgi:hypothetical protein
MKSVLCAKARKTVWRASAHECGFAETVKRNGGVGKTEVKAGSADVVAEARIDAELIAIQYPMEISQLRTSITVRVDTNSSYPATPAG